ncbi:hypothetical protein EG329_010873 [Mollisiaceae sp. DMI_Dod_QoI]|nr:hypothetical protein EG329_010873 [Helotiales sp. DMI_Dod_QoI]
MDSSNAAKSVMEEYHEMLHEERLAASTLVQLSQRAWTEAKIAQQEAGSGLRVANTGRAPSTTKLYFTSEQGSSDGGGDYYYNYYEGRQSSDNFDDDILPEPDTDPDGTITDCSGESCTDCAENGKEAEEKKAVEKKAVEEEAEATEHTKKKTAKKGISKFKYNGPPAYLLADNRDDPYADPNNVVQEPDGTNRPIDWGDYGYLKPKEKGENNLIPRVEEGPTPSTSPNQNPPPSKNDRGAPVAGQGESLSSTLDKHLEIDTSGKRAFVRQSIEPPLILGTEDQSDMDMKDIAGVAHDSDADELELEPEKPLQEILAPKEAAPSLEEYSSPSPEDDSEPQLSTGIQTSVNSSSENISNAFQTLETGRIESALFPEQTVKFETSDLRSTLPKQKLRLTVSNKNQTSPSKVPADKKRFDKDVQAEVRKFYAEKMNLPELEHSDNDVPDENKPGSTRRRIRKTPEDDYPIPVKDDMKIHPQMNTYVRVISGRVAIETPHQHWESRQTDIRTLEVARLRQREKEIRQTAQDTDDKDPGEAGQQSPKKDQEDEFSPGPSRHLKRQKVSEESPQIEEGEVDMDSETL